MRLGMKVTLTTILLAVGTAAFVAASAQDQNYPFPDPTHIPFTVPDNIQWEGSPSRGEQQYKIFGDPAKPGGDDCAGRGQHRALGWRQG
jgi:hypothetical protein